ncbi:carbonic anhydrase [Shewanella marina]|uniref:carbonic anhydrase n=1 Tax=Shewanella marina TaxID=487319 RepID=UPI000AB87088|nr:carbonic anhydrase family protein [Shewanella marina]
MQYITRSSSLMSSFGLVLALAVAPASYAAQWGYGTNNGPQHWGEHFTICASGQNQSPIDINRAVDADLADLMVEYQGQVAQLLNNGHTVEAKVAGTNQLLLDGEQFQLKQFHFHTPSENMINGKQYPMEAHFVHANAQGQLAVIGVMFEQSKQDNPVLTQLFKQLPQNGKSVMVTPQVNVAEMLPKANDYYRFNGSLTTPPCSEGVRWLVLQHPVSASKAQITKLHAMMGNNNRPLQAINARLVVED